MHLAASIDGPLVHSPPLAQLAIMLDSGVERICSQQASPSKVAAAIRAAVEQDAAEAELFIDDEGMEAPEGRVLTRLHRVRERNQKLVEQRKTKALREKGALTCEVCEFDYEKRYGKRGYGFIEAHHTRALASLPENGMIHAQKPWLSARK